jgi:hypothetical protein
MVPAAPNGSTPEGRHPTAHRVVEATEAEAPAEAVVAALGRLHAVRTETVESVAGCAHTRADVKGTGLRVCRDCGAIKGAGGVWRVP